MVPTLADNMRASLRGGNIVKSICYGFYVGFDCLTAERVLREFKDDIREYSSQTTVPSPACRHIQTNSTTFRIASLSASTYFIVMFRDE